MNTEITDNLNNQSQHPGAILKNEREKKGLTTKQIALALNLPDRFIQYVETADYGKLPGLTFARGYIRNYAKYLELENSEDLVKLFDNQTEGDVTENKTLDFKQIKQLKQISNSIYWLISFVVCIILAGIVFLIWQNYVASKESSESMAPVIIESTHSAANNNNSSVATIPLTTNSDLTNTDSNDHNQQVQGIPLTEIRNTTTADENTVIVEPQTSTAVDLAANNAAQQNTDASLQNVQVTQPISTVKAGEGRVQASFNSNCWVTLTDATGKVLINKLYTANTSLDITGKAPLELVLGAPNATTLTYNGQQVAIETKPGSTHRVKLGQ
ncbi:RodZ domain-containing protein [Entomomonas asaccharolytica]|uniref:Helix-turn-helix domain-containing protein n=1 Tax=Entomomonas asaccharolytica TaxID=2785331 RepID=A0A974RW20_9GAMM|nr:RodZ family helix-turn-helix domain-containing protein [Entomomonas asaccharolytica]QQP84622.1 helix-turn-helix domain-containing protein [Entomomonas asaccharolytica]